MKFFPEATYVSKNSISYPYFAGVAFLTGIIPDAFLRWLNLQLKKIINFEGESVNQLYGPTNLQSKIDGISFWEADRLTEEGIESIHDLAMKELPSHLLNTRFDTSLLLSWVNQALLYNQMDELVTQFRNACIRNASELIYLAKRESGLKKILCSIEDGLKRRHQSVRHVGKEPESVTLITLSMLENIIAGLENGPNLLYICKYRNQVSYRSNKDELNPHLLPEFWRLD